MNIKSEKLFYLLSKIIFIIYIILLVWVIVFKCNYVLSFDSTYQYFKNYTIQERIDFGLIPFADYFVGPFITQLDTIIEDDILNVFVFMPLGMYLTLFLKNKRFIKVLLISITFSTLFELFQLFSLIGSFSTKDLITNTIGGILGYLICLLIYKKENSILKIKILNILSIIVIILFIPVVLYAIINTIKHLDLYIKILNRTY